MPASWSSWPTPTWWGDVAAGPSGPGREPMLVVAKGCLTPSSELGGVDQGHGALGIETADIERGRLTQDHGRQALRRRWRVHHPMTAEPAAGPHPGTRSWADQRVMIEGHLVVPGPVSLRPLQRRLGDEASQPLPMGPPSAGISRAGDQQPSSTLPEVVAGVQLEGDRRPGVQPGEGADLEDPSLDRAHVQPYAQPSPHLA